MSGWDGGEVIVLWRAPHAVENCADLKNRHGGDVPLPGDVLIGTDQQHVGPVVLPEVGIA